MRKRSLVITLKMGPVYDTLCYDKREDNFTFAVQICKPNQSGNKSQQHHETCQRHTTHSPDLDIVKRSQLACESRRDSLAGKFELKIDFRDVIIFQPIITLNYHTRESCVFVAFLAC